MKVDIYQTQNAAKIYIFVKADEDPMRIIPLKFRPSLGELKLFQKDIAIERDRALEHLDANAILDDIQNKNFSLQSAMITTYE